MACPNGEVRRSKGPRIAARQAVHFFGGAMETGIDTNPSRLIARRMSVWSRKRQLADGGRSETTLIFTDAIKGVRNHCFTES
jgi:hypothetical protein